MKMRFIDISYKSVLSGFLLSCLLVSAAAQNRVDLSAFNSKSGVNLSTTKNSLTVQWPLQDNEKGEIVLDLQEGKPLFSTIGLRKAGSLLPIAKDLEPAFLLRRGKRTLDSARQWVIFFDKVPERPSQTDRIEIGKKNASVTSDGSRTVIRIGNLSAPEFSGSLELTLFNGSPLLNIAAVMHTEKDSTAILYDAGLVDPKKNFKTISWYDAEEKLRNHPAGANDTATNQALRFRAIAATQEAGSLVVFPAPHQYFYPLDEAFNTGYNWYGNNYAGSFMGYGLGIRQAPEGDHRFVPWFNAPPGTDQRLNFFLWIGAGTAEASLQEVKAFTHADKYKPLPGKKTFVSHFHNEYIMSVVMKGKAEVENPEFVRVFRRQGIDIAHLAEFHYTAHPKGPDSTRLKELYELFRLCRRVSARDFMLLPGEEPNEFFGGHWVQLFPKPVYWVMDRKQGQAFDTTVSPYGTVYHIGNASDMLQLLEKQKGLAWTAHPRIKGSVGYPDRYKEKEFYRSPWFLGGAWKAMPADLSRDKLGERVLGLQDDMNNWGQPKRIVGESDLFSITLDNEMYAHMNVNYLQLDSIPEYDKGWPEVTNALQQGKYFTTTGEILLPAFSIDGVEAGDTLHIGGKEEATLQLEADWTFPLQYLEIISGDGNQTFQQRVPLTTTKAFGRQMFEMRIPVAGRKWIRVEVWDAAVNGAFTQTIWLTK